MYPDVPCSNLPREIQADEFLPPISLWTIASSWLLVGTLSAAFTLAAVLKYNVTVKAPASVRPSGDLRIVQASTVGTVKDIAVRDNSVVNQGDAIAFIENSQQQILQNQLQGKIRQNQLQLSQMQAEIQNRSAEGKSNVQEAIAALELAQSQLSAAERLARAGAIPRSELQEKRIAFAMAKARLQRTVPASNGEVASLLRSQIEIKSQIEQDRKQLQQLEQDLNKSVIRAPVSGTILKLELRNRGQHIQAGETIARIAPKHDALVIKAYVPAQDIAKVSICQLEQVSACEEGKVQLRISAYPYPDYGTLRAAVRAISPDVITSRNGNSGDEAGTNSSEPVYEVTIQPEKPYLQTGNRQHPLQAGMDVTADIVAQEETVLTFLLRKARLLTSL